MYAVAYGVLGQRETAEELAQDVFVRCYLHLHTLKEARAFAAWVHRVARHLALDWQKHRERASKLVQMIEGENLERVAAPQPHVAERLQTSELHAQVSAAIRSLPRSQREMVLLHYVEGLTPNETAQRLGVWPSTVTRQLRRAIVNLQRELEPLRHESAGMRSRPEGVARAVGLLAPLSRLPWNRLEVLTRSSSVPASPASPQAWLLATSKGVKLMASIIATAALGIAYLACSHGPTATPRVVAQADMAHKNAIDMKRISTQVAHSETSASATETVRQTPAGPDSLVTAHISAVTTSPDGMASRAVGSNASGTTAVRHVAVTTSSQRGAPVARQGEVSGVVTDEAGSPLSGIPVQANWVQAQPGAPGNNVPANISGTNTSVNTMTDANGQFIFENLPAGPVALRAFQTVPTTLDVVAPARSVHITLPEGASIEGRVVDANGKGVPGAKLRCGYLSFATQFPVLEFYGIREPTDAEGRFIVRHLPPDSYALSAEVDGNQYTTRELREERTRSSQQVPTRAAQLLTTTSKEYWTRGYLQLHDKETTTGFLLEPWTPPPLPKPPPLGK